MVDVKSISVGERIVVLVMHGWSNPQILWFYCARSYEIDVTIYDKLSENFTLV